MRIIRNCLRYEVMRWSRHWASWKFDSVGGRYADVRSGSVLRDDFAQLLVDNRPLGPPRPIANRLPTLHNGRLE